MKQKDIRILIVTRNFPPLTGGMEKLLFHIFKALEQRFDARLIGPTGCEKFIGKSAVASFPYSPLPHFLLSCFWQTLKNVQKFRPHLILSGSGITAPAALFAGKLFHIPVAAYLHGLDIAVNNAGYQAVFVPLIRACDGVIVNSSFTAKLAEKSGINKSKITILNPGTSLPSFSEVQSVSKDFRQRLNAGDRPIIISVGRLTERKGILQLIENCMAQLIAAIPEILFIIIGGEAKDAVNPSVGMTERIRRLIASKGYENHVLMLGKVSDEILQKAYASSDLLVFPVIERPGDIEGFGMVAIEAAAYGLPTVAFSTGGVVDAVANNISGRLIETGKYDRFTEAIIHLLNKPGIISANGCKAFARRFSWQEFGEKLSKICLNYIK